MNLLLIEDEDDKCRAVSNRLTEILGSNLNLIVCHSLRGGLKAILHGKKFDLVILDMSMPGFEPEPGESAFVEEPESFAGEEIMAQMKLRGLESPVVVFTQYRAFAGGTIGLEQLTRKYEDEYPEFFRGTIYYSTAVDSWKKELAEILVKVKNANSLGR